MRIYDVHYSGDHVQRFSLDIGSTKGINNPETKAFLLGGNFKGSLEDDISYAARVHESFGGGKTQFVAMLTSNSLWFCRCDKLEDIFEGVMPKLHFLTFSIIMLRVP